MVRLRQAAALIAAGAVWMGTESRADEVELVSGGGVVGRWDRARSPSRLHQEFERCELDVDTKSGVVHWRFVSRGIGFNDIFLRREVERPFRCLRLRVRNRGAALTLAVKVRDASGAEWTARRVPLAAGGEVRTIEFSMPEWQVASWSKDPDGALDFPLSFLAVIAFDIDHRQPCELDFHRVEWVRPEPPEARISDVELPARMQAGETYAVAFSFVLDRRCPAGNAELQFRDREGAAFRVPLTLPKPLSDVAPGETVHVAQPLPIPLYGRGGELSVGLTLGEARAVSADGEPQPDGIARVRIQARQPGHTTARVAMWRGLPRLQINGKVHSGMAYTAYRPEVSVFRDFAEAGVDLFSFAATPTEGGYGLSRTVWTGPGEYDYSQFDERVLMILEANPEAFIFPRIYLHAPTWWSAQHPDDLVQFDPGDGTPQRFIHSGGKPAPSWVSEPWRAATIRGLQGLVDHVKASPYADRIIGYHLASGTTEEWMMWGANENQWVGYSPATVAAFRRWLRERYESDETLRMAWGRDDVSLTTAAVPSRTARARSRFGALRAPEQEQAVIDFYAFNSEMTAGTIAYFAAAVKRMTNREKVIGTFYGYTLQLCGEQRQQNAGHLALRRILNCPDVDFVCSPTSYAFRAVGGEGTSHFMSLTQSIQLHGKLWFDENDIRTSLAPGKVGGWGRPESIEGDVLQQNKELANVLTTGVAQWWFDVGRNRYDDPRLMAHLGAWAQRAERVVPLDRTPADQIAFAVDEHSLIYLRTGHRLGRWLLLDQLPALYRVGAPVGCYEAGDLRQLRDHRLIILPTSFAPDAAQRRAVDELKGEGRVLLFLGYPGIYREGVLKPAAMKAFTGIDLEIEETSRPLKARLEASPEGTVPLEAVDFGPGKPCGPVAVSRDPEATVWARFPDGRPALVVKSFRDWTAAFSAVPELPTAVLARLADLAGVHRYVPPGDVVWANRSMLAICVTRGGTRTIRLPRPCRVRDLADGSILAEQSDRFEAHVDDRDTRVFLLESFGERK